MKKGIKLYLALTGALFAFGLVLHLAGAVMGGRSESNQYFEERWDDISEGDFLGPILVGSDGVHIGGENGIHVDGDGVSIGGEHGIHVENHGKSGYSGKNQQLESGELTGITSVEVEVDCGDIWVQEGESVSVSLSWNMSNYAMDYRVENGVLKIEDESWGSVKSDGLIDCGVLVTVPAGMALDELDLSTDMGDIEVDATITARVAELSTDLGDISCRSFQAFELEAESDLGDVTLHLPGSREDYTWDLETSMGELTLEGEKQSGGMGTITSCGGSGKNLVEASASLGNIELLFLK